jgi:hypothetical protein
MARTATVTIGFIRRVGSTELVSRLGYDVYAARRQEHFAALSTAVAADDDMACAIEQGLGTEA